MYFGVWWGVGRCVSVLTRFKKFPWGLPPRRSPPMSFYKGMKEIYNVSSPFYMESFYMGVLPFPVPSSFGWGYLLYGVVLVSGVSFLQRFLPLLYNIIGRRERVLATSRCAADTAPQSTPFLAVNIRLLGLLYNTQQKKIQWAKKDNGMRHAVRSGDTCWARIPKRKETRERVRNGQSRQRANWRKEYPSTRGRLKRDTGKIVNWKASQGKRLFTRLHLVEKRAATMIRPLYRAR